jgi:hypothetical protein
MDPLDSKWTWAIGLSGLVLLGTVCSFAATIVPMVMSFIPEVYDKARARNKRVQRKYARVMKKSVEKSLGPLSAEVLKVSHNETIQMILKNMVRLTTSDNPDQVIGSGVFIAGTTMITNHHIMDHLVELGRVSPGLLLTLHPLRAKGHKVSIPLCELEGMCVDFANEHHVEGSPIEDVIMVEFPRNLFNSYKDIRRHIAEARPSDAASYNKVQGAIVVPNSLSQIPVVYNAVLIPTGNKTYSDEHGNEYVMTAAYGAAYASFRGMCGTPTFILCDDGNAFFAGIHASGNGFHAMTICVSRNQFDSVKTFDRPFEVSDVPGVLSPQALTEDFVRAKEDVSSNIILAQVKQSVYLENKHHAIPEMVKVFGTLGKAPSKTKPFRINGVLVDPMKKAQANYTGSCVMMNQDLLDDIVEALSVHTYNKGGIGSRVLTFDEAIQGVPELDFPGITRNTSAGVMKFYGQTPGRGKQNFLGNTEDRSVYGPDIDILRTSVSEMLSQIEAGGRPMVVFTDTLKDEVVSETKAMAGDTRLVSGADLRLVVISRMYYGALQGSMMESDKVLYNGCAKGYNPYTSCGLLRKLLEGKSNRLAFDYKKWDTKIWKQVLEAAFDIMDSTYPRDESESVKRVRRWVRSTVTESAHWNSGAIFIWLSMISSGHPLTIDIANFCNKIFFGMGVARFALEKANPSWASPDPIVLIKYQTGSFDFLRFFQENVVITMGDDIIAGLTHEFDGITSKDFALTLAYYGVTITNGDKTSPLDYPQSHLMWSDLSFLKRGFSFINGYDVCPLELESILKSVVYTERGMKLDDYIRVCETACLELSMHGEVVFQKYVPLIDDVVKRLHGVALQNTNFKRSLMRIRGTEFCYW